MSGWEVLNLTWESGLCRSRNIHQRAKMIPAVTQYAAPGSSHQWPQPPLIGCTAEWRSGEGQRSGRGGLDLFPVSGFLLRVTGRRRSVQLEEEEEEQEVLWGGEDEHEEEGEQHGWQQGEAGQSDVAATGGVVCQEGLRRLVDRVIWERHGDKL